MFTELTDRYSGRFLCCFLWGSMFLTPSHQVFVLGRPNENNDFVLLYMNTHELLFPMKLGSLNEAGPFSQMAK